MLDARLKVKIILEYFFIGGLCGVIYDNLIFKKSFKKK
jgi:hypothetical protein